MILYNGKQYTGFSYAVNTLFSKTCLSFPSDPECLSMRSAVYYQDSFFIPLFRWDVYMDRLIKNAGFSHHYYLASADAVILNKMNTGTLFLLGDVKYPKWDMTVVHKICTEHNAFLVCRKLQNGYEIANPLGCQSMVCNTEQILDLVIDGVSFIFEIENGINLKMPPPIMLIYELIDLLETYPLILGTDHYPIMKMSSKDKVRFQYGLISYIQSRYHYCEFFSLNNRVQEKLSLININDQSKVYSKVIEAESYFLESLYEASRKE